MLLPYYSSLHLQSVFECIFAKRNPLQANDCAGQLTLLWSQQHQYLWGVMDHLFLHHQQSRPSNPFAQPLCHLPVYRLAVCAPLMAHYSTPKYSDPKQDCPCGACISLTAESTLTAQSRCVALFICDSMISTVLQITTCS